MEQQVHQDKVLLAVMAIIKTAKTQATEAEEEARVLLVQTQLLLLVATAVSELMRIQLLHLSHLLE
jgi:hypothetical protein